MGKLVDNPVDEIYPLTLVKLPPELHEVAGGKWAAFNLDPAEVAPEVTSNEPVYVGTVGWVEHFWDYDYPGIGRGVCPRDAALDLARRMEADNGTTDD